MTPSQHHHTALHTLRCMSHGRPAPHSEFTCSVPAQHCSSGPAMHAPRVESVGTVQPNPGKCRGHGVWAEIVVHQHTSVHGRRPHVQTMQLPFRGECHGAGRRVPDQHGHESIHSATCRGLPGRRLPALRPSEPSQRATRSRPCWEGEGAAQGGVWGLERLCQSPHFQ